MKMQNIRIIVAIVLFVFVGVLYAVAQEKVAVLDSAVAAPSPLIGKWKGTWESAGRSLVHGDMNVEVLSYDGDRLTGKVKVTSAQANGCTNLWEIFSGVKRGEKLTLSYNLGGRCGNVTLDLSLKGNLLLGSYVSEFPGSGDIRLKRE